jgi:ketosteroid isomerase-like protein
MNDHPKTSYPVPKWKRLRVQGLLLGAGLVLIGLLAWSLTRGTAVSPTSDKKPDQVQQVQVRPAQSAAAAPRVGPKVAAESTAGLKSQIEQVLTGIKEANQKKDLSQLLSYYSPNFPQLPQRAQSISKAWKVYDYPKMEFEIKDVRLVADNNAVIKVTWNVEVQNISTKKYKDMSKTYLVRFAKESGQWRIKALEKTE